jgi:hypothetical protein
MNSTTRWAVRLVGAGLLGATAGIHADLYNEGYKTIPKIGPMFLALVIGASILCLVVGFGPQRILRLAALAGAGLEAATVIGLFVFTHHEIFNFMETTQAPHYWTSVVVEVAGTVILGGLALTGGVRRNPYH